jgi:hypothetical protein
VFYQLRPRVSGHIPAAVVIVKSRDSFFHAELSLLPVMRLDTQRKQHLGTRSSKCLDSSAGCLVVIACFTLKVNSVVFAAWSVVCIIIYGEETVTRCKFQ